MSSEHHIIVYLYDEQVYAELVSHGAYASTVRYSLDGVLYEVMVENEEFDIVEDITIGIEEEY